MKVWLVGVMQALAPSAPGPDHHLHAGREPGDTIEVSREDGTKARVVVDGLTRYPKKRFSLALGYGRTGRAQLRVDHVWWRLRRAAKTYKDNIVVFATLVP